MNINENSIYNIILDKRHPNVRNASNNSYVYNFCRRFGVSCLSSSSLTQEQVNTLCMGVILCQNAQVMFNTEHEMVRNFMELAKNNETMDYYISKIRETWFVEKDGDQKVGDIALHRASIQRIIQKTVYENPEVRIKKAKEQRPRYSEKQNVVTNEQEDLRSIVKSEIEKFFEVKDVKLSKKVKPTVTATLKKNKDDYKREAKIQFTRRLNKLVNVFLINKNRNMHFPNLYSSKKEFAIEFSKIGEYRNKEASFYSFCKNNGRKYPELKKFYEENFKRTDVITHDDIVRFGQILKQIMIKECKFLKAA